MNRKTRKQIEGIIKREVNIDKLGGIEKKFTKAIGGPLDGITRFSDSEFVQNKFARSVWDFAAQEAQRLGLKMPQILVIAEWEGMSTTCTNQGNNSFDLIRLLNIGHYNLVMRGLIEGTETN